MRLNTIYQGDSLGVLKSFPDHSVNCCVTSPPYWNLRDYNASGQMGLEKTPEEYIKNMVAVFGEVKRVLKKDGTLWLNIGDSYCSTAPGSKGDPLHIEGLKIETAQARQKTRSNTPEGMKPQDLVGIPWMLAFALRADGWYLRCDIIWSKKNCMPESVTDRPTKSHEYIFLLSKSPVYYYDHEAIKELAVYDVNGTGTAARKARQKESNKLQPTEVNNGIRAASLKPAALMNGKHSDKQAGHGRRHEGFNDRWDEKENTGMRNKRSVWTVAPAQFPEAHFATFPEKLIIDCIKAGCPLDGIVLDPFMGGGTTALVASKLQRNYVGIELNPDYIKIAENRLSKTLGMFNPVQSCG